MDDVAGAGFAGRALANVVAEEVVVDAVAARILGGEADAGVLYSTDVAARAPQLRTIEIPRHAAVRGTNYACVVSATADRLAARGAQAVREARATTWLDTLFAAPAQAILRDAGFTPFSLRR